MSNKVLLSVIVPMYNVEHIILPLLENLKSQYIEGVEYILIDDGSSDNTYNVCKDFISGLSFFKIVSIKNSGVSNARNIGIEHSNGEFLFFLDSDDSLSLNFISSFMTKYNSIDKNNLYKVDTKKRIKNEILDFSYFNSSNNIDNIFELLLSGKLPGYSWGYFFRRDVVINFKYKKDINFMEDLLFLITYIIESKVSNIILLNDCYYIYDINTSGLTNSVVFKEKHIFDAFDVIYHLKHKFKDKNNILNKRLFKVIESEIGKTEKYNLILDFSDKLKSLLKSMLSDSSLSFKFYYIFILNNLLLFDIYIFIRKFLKKVKKVIKK